MRALALVLLAGCDAVLGLDGDPPPCSAAAFDDATTAELGEALTFSVSRDESLIVMTDAGLPYQVVRGAARERIDLGAYVPASYALAPDGGSLFYTAAVEPPTLLGAQRDGDGWKLALVVPPVTYAGTPSAGEYGPRRMLARIGSLSPVVQELEEVDGAWVPHGDPLPVPGGFAPNLTPTGLDMVFATTDGVFLASRPSLDAAFGDPTLILSGDHRAPQLVDTCRALYTIDGYETDGFHADHLRSHRR